MTDRNPDRDPRFDPPPPLEDLYSGESTSATEESEQGASTPGEETAAPAPGPSSESVDDWSPPGRAERLTIDFEVPRIDGPGRWISETLRVFTRHFVMIAKITLVVFIPVELIKGYLVYGPGLEGALIDLDDLLFQIRIDNWIQLGIGSLVAPALIYALVVVLRGEPAPGLRESYSWGLRRWGRTFGNRFLANLATLAGFILCIVPGILAWIWLCLVDPVVAVEADWQQRVLTRSRELVRGHAWTVVFGGLGLFLVVMLGAGVLGIPLFLWELWWLQIVTDILTDLFYPLFTVAFLLAYLSFSAEERVSDVFD